MNSLARLLAETYAHLRDVTRGEVAGYIPALAAMPPDLLGLALLTTEDGFVEAGDSRHPFTIQSISKRLGKHGPPYRNTSSGQRCSPTTARHTPQRHGKWLIFAKSILTNKGQRCRKIRL